MFDDWNFDFYLYLVSCILVFDKFVFFVLVAFARWKHLVYPVLRGSIPNLAVKRRSADDNASERECESRPSPA